MCTQELQVRDDDTVVISKDQDLDSLANEAGYGYIVPDFPDEFHHDVDVLAYAFGWSVESYVSMKQNGLSEQQLDAFTNTRSECLEAALYMLAKNREKFDEKSCDDSLCWICRAACRVGASLYRGMQDRKTVKNYIEIHYG